jgi:hypothetical protein
MPVTDITPHDHQYARPLLTTGLSATCHQTSSSAQHDTCSVAILNSYAYAAALSVPLWCPHVCCRLVFIKSLTAAPTDPAALQHMSDYWLGCFGLLLPPSFPFLMGVATHPEAEAAQIQVGMCVFVESNTTEVKCVSRVMVRKSSQRERGKPMHKRQRDTTGVKCAACCCCCSTPLA